MTKLPFSTGFKCDFVLCVSTEVAVTGIGVVVVGLFGPTETVEDAVPLDVCVVGDVEHPTVVMMD